MVVGPFYRIKVIDGRPCVETAENVRIHHHRRAVLIREFLSNIMDVIGRYLCVYAIEGTADSP